MKKNLILYFILLSLISLLLMNCKKISENEEWRPKKPINLIVPWPAGGATDRISRMLASALEPCLEDKIIINNQPGASGSLGTKICMDAQNDGYTWTAGAAKDLGNYKVKGFLDTTINDWHLYLGMWIPVIVAVNADSKYKTFDDLLIAFKISPNKLKVATAGINSVGQAAIESIKKLQKFNINICLMKAEFGQ